MTGKEMAEDVFFDEPISRIKRFWDSEKNDVSIDDVSMGSPNHRWWKCEKGHSWQAAVNKVGGGGGCPYCTHKRVLKGFNDLASLYPSVASDWDYERNECLPSEVFSKSHRKVWWKCSVGHAWQASISSRTNGNGCPCCASERQVSFPEKAVFYYIKLHFEDAKENYKISDTNGLELDIFIPSEKVGIEYDGGYWHRSLERDIQKNDLCVEQGIKLYRIRDKVCPPMRADNCEIIQLQTDSLKELEDAISRVIRECKKGNEKPLDIHIERDTSQIYSLFGKQRKAKSIKSLAGFADEWVVELNEVDSSLVSANSNRVFWWRCPNGHEYQMAPVQRMSGANCPVCAGRRVVSGVNDLLSQEPEISKEWNYARNEKTPEKIYFRTKRSAWWMCAQGHEWKTAVSNRVVHKSGCPVCAEKRIELGSNDLTTIAPNFLKYWDYQKNTLTPDKVGKGSHARVWLKCPVGHEWQGAICDEIKRKGCPVCSGRKIVQGVNDLFSMFPELEVEWDYRRNEEDPRKLSASAKRKVFWVCQKCGNGWEAYVFNRAIHHSGCPKCAKKRKQSLI